MNASNLRPVVLGLILLSASVVASNASAAEHIVNMKNSGQGGTFVFEPAYVEAAVGDTVRFVPVDLGHNAESITGMTPDGAPQLVGEMSKEAVIKLTKAGLYGIECKPHVYLGMVALIKAGKGPARNYSAASQAKLPDMAKARMAPLLARAR